MNEPNRDRPDAALAQAYRDLQSPGSAQCPETEQLAALALRELSAGERDRVADHIVSCRRCSEDYQILARTNAEASAGRRSDPRRWAAAAVIAMALAAGLFFASRGRVGTETERGRATSAGSLTTPPAGAELKTAPTQLVWPAQREAEGYHVKLFAASGDLLFETDAGKANRLTLPLEARARLQAGKSYFWVVEVQMPLEKQRLGPFSFTLRR